MTANGENGTCTFKVSGVSHNYEEPPPKLPVKVVGRKTERRFDGLSFLDLALSIDWKNIAEAAAGKLMYDLSKWLFMRFRPPRETAQDEVTAETEAEIEIEITVGDTTTTVVVTGPEDLAEKLKEILDRDGK